jgi:hypothetical protein
MSEPVCDRRLDYITVLSSLLRTAPLFTENCATFDAPLSVRVAKTFSEQAVIHLWFGLSGPREPIGGLQAD